MGLWSIGGSGSLDKTGRLVCRLFLSCFCLVLSIIGPTPVVCGINMRHRLNVCHQKQGVWKRHFPHLN
jgi:hypothetical protein